MPSALLLTLLVTLGWSLPLFVPQLSHLYSGSGVELNCGTLQVPPILVLQSAGLLISLGGQTFFSQGLLQSWEVVLCSPSVWDGSDVHFGDLASWKRS